MQPNAERWQTARTLYRIFRCGGTDHQAGCRQDSLAMGAFYGFVHRDGEAEIIGRNDKAPSAWQRRTSYFSGNPQNEASMRPSCHVEENPLLPRVTETPQVCGRICKLILFAWWS
jgi:hypothetical protein